MRLLLVEDDLMIGESVQTGLRREHYAVDWVYDGATAERAIATQEYDLMLLDLGLPHKQGLPVLRNLRQQGNDLAVLIVTARDSTAERVAGLDAGADDYLVKPFDLDELLARIRALMRRRVSRTSSIVTHGKLVLDLARHEVRYDDLPVKLSAREFAVLRALLDEPGSVVTKTRLEEKLYGWNAGVESNAVDVYVHHLRKKLSPELICNVRGVGYKIGTPE